MRATVRAAASLPWKTVRKIALSAAADPAGQRRDRGAGQQHPPDQQDQDGEDPRADRAEQVGEPGLDPVADLAAFPAEEEDEDEVDAEGDQEEADQVEVALLQPGRQVQPAFRLGRFGAFFARLWLCARARASCERTCCPGSTRTARTPAAKFALNPAGAADLAG